MQKSDLINLIKKYYLEGICQNVRCTVQDKVLKVAKKSEDASVLVLLDANADLPDGEFGVLATGNLLTLLGALDEDIKVDYQYHKNKQIGLTLSDNVTTATFLLGDLSLDEFAPAGFKSALPEFDVEIPLKKDLVDRFVKGRKSLSDAKLVAFIPSETEVDVVINFDPSHGSNRITIPFPAKVQTQFDIAAFNIDPIQKAFSANTDFREGSISISTRGLMEIKFKGEDYEVKYYLNKLDIS